VDRTSFDDGWRVRPKVSHFLELLGGEGEPWEEVTLPHDAMLAGRRDPAGHWGNGFFPGGVWEYERTFRAAEELRGKRVLLEFEGVYRGASVWVNGALAGHRPYGYTDFAVSIGEHLRFGDDNTVRVHAISHDDSRWYSGAGIYRPVHLVVGGPVHLALDAVEVTTPSVDDDGAVVAVATTIENESLTTAATVVTTELVDPAGEVIARDVAPLTVFPGRPETLRQRLFVARPRRWGVDAPHLYTCHTRVEADDAALDQESTTFGIRTVDADAVRGLRVNGRPVALRGACIHHDNGVIGAATIARADERRVEILKGAGFNALRSAHHPMSRGMLDACDRLGMLVMDEAFDMWTESKNDDDYGRVFPDWWEADVDAMVRKDRNHPSVIMYSIGNEIPDTGTPAGASIGRAICERIRALDSTRLVTNSINPLLSCGPALFASLGAGVDAPSTSPDMGVNTIMSMMEHWLPVLLQQDVVDEKTAESFAYLDVCGYNYAESRYAMDHELHPHRVIVGSETNPGKIAANWRLVQEQPHVIGDFTWTGWDYLGESGIARVQYGDGDGHGLMGSYPWITSNTGDIDITGFRRPVSYWREVVWGLRTAPYLAVRPPAHHGERSTVRQGWSFTDAIASWSWDGCEGAPVTVEVYADADEVELLVNGESAGRAAVGEMHPFLATVETTYAPGELVAIARRDGRETGRTALLTAVGPVHLDLALDRARIDATGRDLAYVEITLVDAAGTPHPDMDRAVTVVVDGPGSLQGLGSGNPCTEETFSGATHDTFQGRALAVVRPTGPGTIAVTVSAPGCDDAVATVDAVAP
jgi:beta-galactosidase